jgi:type I site-specific restriction-modification system R (restriction) subunit
MGDSVEALVGSDKRLAMVAADLVRHFEDRIATLDGKAMVVCLSRRICVAAAGIHRNTVSNFETGRYAGTDEAINAMRRAFEAAGVIFLDNGDGPGVKLKQD